MNNPARDPMWLLPDEREAILRRNICDDTPLVERQRDIARLLDLAARSRHALDVAEATASDVPDAPLPVPVL